MKYALILACALLCACTSKPISLPPNQNTEVIVVGGGLYDDGCGA